MALQTEAYT